MTAPENVPMDVTCPAFTRQWWLQMQTALGHLAGTYGSGSRCERLCLRLSAWCGRRALTARAAR